MVENGDWNSLLIFERNQHVSRGIKAGFITPTLHCLNPRFRIINKKTIVTVNLLAGRPVIGRELSRYKQYLAYIDTALEELDIPLFKEPDIFDAFCHWLCDKRLGGYARFEKSAKATEEEEVIPLLDEHLEPQNYYSADSNALAPLGRTSGNIWLFQANPAYYNLQERVREVQIGDEDDWTVTRYREDIQIGNIVVLW